MDKQFNIILLGKAGAGKGTQAKIIANQYNLMHISTGDLIRENIKNNTIEGQKAKEYSNNGLLVPDTLILHILFNEIRKYNINNDNEIKKYNGFIFDGFPRNDKQAKLLVVSLKRMFNMKINLVLDYMVPDEIAINRIKFRAEEGLKNGEKVRLDDLDEKAIRNRLNIYNIESSKIKSFFRKIDKINVFEIDATQNIEIIKQNTDLVIQNALKKC